MSKKHKSLKKFNPLKNKDEGNCKFKGEDGIGEVGGEVGGEVSGEVGRELGGERNLNEGKDEGKDVTKKN